MFTIFNFYLINFCLCADPSPLLQTTCDSERQVYNSSEYGCYECPNNLTRIENVCRPANSSFIIANSNPIKYVSECPDGLIPLGLVCFQNNITESHIQHLKEEFIANYYDVQNSPSSNYDHISVQINDEYLEQYAYAELFHAADPFNQTAVALLSNACSVFSYDFSTYSCIQFNRNFTQGSGNKYGYLFWPLSGPFITYGDNYPLRYISEEDYVMQSYDLGDPISFQLAQFSKYGEFKGFTKLNMNFQKCSDTNDNINSWQKFGYNYYSECLVDLEELTLIDSTDFFDPFVEDGTYEGKTILRPILVVLKNYRGTIGEEINRRGDDENYRAVRRFFMNDNYTSNEIVQHIKSFTVTFNLKPNDKHKIYPPIFTIEYLQVHRGDLEKNDFSVNFDLETVSTPKYSFKVVYLKGMNSFWQAVIIVFCLCLAIGLVYYFVNIIMFIRTYAIDGLRSSVFVGIFGYFFDLMGTILFIVSFALSIYVFIFFKFQTSSFICLPEEDDFMLLIPVLLVALGLKLIGVIFMIILKSSTNVFIIDWETPKEEDIPISGWRRIMVANEWNRILTVRHYNLPFTLLSMSFIIGGFDLNLLATPIPSTKLVEMDKEYFILRFAFYSFVWLLLILFQFLMSKFVLWRIFGDPFLNFIDLCSTSNISVFIRTCSYQGYYIHGKSPHLSADQDMKKLSSNLRKEGKKRASERGLVEGKPDQVFETFLTDECRHQINDLYNSQVAQTGSPSVLNFKVHAAGDIPHAAYEVNEEVNEFLKNFFNNNSDHKFVVQPKNFLHYFFDIPPITVGESIFLIVNESRYNVSLVSGIEWKLQLFYLLIFVCVAMAISSPCIPSLIIFIIDFIIIKIFNLFGRSNLSKKTLLDDRFFL